MIHLSNENIILFVQIMMNILIIAALNKVL